MVLMEEIWGFMEVLKDLGRVWIGEGNFRLNGVLELWLVLLRVNNELLFDLYWIFRLSL